MQGKHNQRAILIAAIGLLALFFVTVAASNISNWRPVGGDEVWTIFTAEKLARDGTFGNELFEGFFNAESRYFFGLPVQPVLHAAVFKLTGPGIVPARAVSVAATIITLLVIAGLSLRWFGLRAALITALLFIFWRNNLTNQDSGMSLLGVGRSARWDVTPLPWMWLAIWAFDVLRRESAMVFAILAGVFVGIAAQTHYFGGFVAGGIALAWIWPGQSANRPPIRALAMMLFGVTVAVMPWLLFVLQHFQEAVAQFTLVHGRRTEFLDLSTLPARLAAEQLRYAEILTRVGIGNWVLAVCSIPVYAYIGYLAFGRGDAACRFLFFCSLSILVGLAIIDTSKAPLYSIALLPAFCMAFAKAFNDCMPTDWPRPKSPRALVRFAAPLGLLILLVEGATAYAIDFGRGKSVTPYAALGARIESRIAPGARVIGPVRWAWALREHHFWSADNIVLRRRAGLVSGDVPTVKFLFEAHSIQFLLISASMSQEIETRWPTDLKLEFGRFIRDCNRHIAEWNDKTYGQLDLYRVDLETESCG